MIDASFENLSPFEQKECLREATIFFNGEYKKRNKLKLKYKKMFDNMVAFLSLLKDKEQGIFYIENFLNKNFKNDSLKNTLYEILIYDILKL